MTTVNSASPSKTASPENPKKVRGKNTRRNQLYTWARWLHVYISTATLLLVLFFSITGITLNHPDWMFGTTPVSQDFSGVLPDGWQVDEQIDWLKISEYMRSEYDVGGRVSDYWSDEREGQLSFAAPAYSADVFIDIKTGDYQLYTDAQGFVVAMNDLHRGRDAGNLWKWVIDLSGAFLILVSITGLVLLLLLKKIRMRGLLTIIAGSVLSVWLIRLAL